MPPFLSNAGTMDAGCSDMRCTNRSRTSSKFSSYTHIYSSKAIVDITVHSQFCPPPLPLAKQMWPVTD